MDFLLILVITFVIATIVLLIFGFIFQKIYKESTFNFWKEMEENKKNGN